MEPSHVFRDQTTSLRMNESATKPALLRRALETHQTWIETTLGAPFSDVVILEVHLDLTQMGAERILLAPTGLMNPSRLPAG
jgi:hypothetical protein